jgi:opacity protein-like surface antigen
VACAWTVLALALALPASGAAFSLDVEGLHLSPDLQAQDAEAEPGTESPSSLHLAQAQPAEPEAAPSPPRERAAALRKGSWEAGVMLGYSFSCESCGDAPTGTVVRMYWLVPKIGYTFWEFPKGWPYLGSFQLFLEPAIAYISHPAKTYLLSLSAILRYNFILWRRVVPYLEGGVGFLNTNLRIQALGEVIEFIPQGGGGLRFRITEQISFDLGSRYQHISNAGQTEPSRNLGINSLFFYGAFAYSF